METNTATTNTEPLDTWAIVELMGHVRLAGKLTEESHFGVALGRLDIPAADGGFTTQFFGGSSVYRITPATEEIARAVALHSQPQPVSQWELKRALPSPEEEPEDRPIPPWCRSCDAERTTNPSGFCDACEVAGDDDGPPL